MLCLFVVVRQTENRAQSTAKKHPPPIHTHTHTHTHTAHAHCTLHTPHTGQCGKQSMVHVSEQSVSAPVRGLRVSLLQLHLTLIAPPTFWCFVGFFWADDFVDVVANCRLSPSQGFMKATLRKLLSQSSNFFVSTRPCDSARNLKPNPRKTRKTTQQRDSFSSEKAVFGFVFFLVGFRGTRSGAHC